MSDRADNRTQEQRRPLTREEREAMKRELKAQMRAYVDALKEQILGAKERGENPDLEEALSKAEREAARKLAQQAAQGDPMVEEAARVQAAARSSHQEATVQQPPRHDGVIPKFSAWQPADAQPEDASVTQQDQTQATSTKGEKDVLQVSSSAAATTENSGQGAEDSVSAGVHINHAEQEAPAGQGADDGGQDYIVPEEEAAKSAIPREELERLTRDIIAALKTIYDPEIPVDIYELGLIYRIDIADDRTVTIDMTLTAPGCPVAGDMPGWVQKAVAEVEGVKDVKVNLVFDPPWDMSRMSDEARLALNMF